MPEHGGLLRFRIHRLRLGGIHYVFMPKLNGGQLELLERRLVETGFSVGRGRSLKAESRESTIRVSPGGVCWCSLDPSDTVLPVIPDILASPKEKISLASLKGLYLRKSTGRDVTEAQLITRTESSFLWSKLRSSGECGLTPDEHAVASFLVGRAKGYCEMVTDFPSDDPTPHIYGRRRYFLSRLGPSEAASLLRVVGERGTRNAYVRRDGTIGLAGMPVISRQDWLDLFDELGEWCSFTPS
jgi:hypothetical protein